MDWFFLMLFGLCAVFLVGSIFLTGLIASEWADNCYRGYKDDKTTD